MRRLLAASAFAIISSLILASCGGGSSSSSGSTTPTTPTATVNSITVTGPSGSAKPGDSAQFTATAAMSNGTSQTVTNQATWQSANSGVATISSSGLVVAVAAGDTDIRATYQGVTGTAHVTVTAPTPPAPPPPTTLGVCGTVKEDSGSALVASATVIVKDTSNTTTSDAVGKYCLSVGSTGRIVLRATKSGYDIAEQDVNVTGNMTADIPMHKQSSPSPTPTPTPTPSPSPAPTPSPNGPICNAAAYPLTAPCGVPTAVCADGTLSCAQNRQGACSSHGGVNNGGCWLCPGLLCNGFAITSGESFSPMYGGYSPAVASGGR